MTAICYDDHDIYVEVLVSASMAPVTVCDKSVALVFKKKSGSHGVKFTELALLFLDEDLGGKNH